MKQFLGFVFGIMLLVFCFPAFAQDVPLPTDTQIVINGINEISGAAKAGSIVTAISLALYLFIKIIKMTAVQIILGKISPKLAWSNWPKWICALVVFVVTALASFLGAVGLGADKLPALILGLSAGIPLSLQAMGIDAAVSTVKPAEPVKP